MEDSQKSSTGGSLKPAVVHPIIMKIDGPEETSFQESEDTIETCESGEFRMCNPSFRTSLISPSNPFATSQNKIAKGILKPPQFNINSNNLTAASFMLKPSQLNPFSKNFNDKINSEKADKSDSKVNGEMPKFVPLVVPDKSIQKVTDSKQQPVDTKVSSSSFVFGENLKERVVAGENENKEESKASTSLGSNGTSEMLFSSAIKNELKADPGETASREKETKSLSESAREYEESRANKRKYEEVEVITGEENETNILNISCKLFSFNKVSSNWLELGRGTLRLNDLGDVFDTNELTGSRIVFRTSGSLRVILNTKMWAEMVVEKANEKSIRITALDANGEIKVFLVMSNIEDSNRLYSHLKTRLEREIASQKRKKLESSNSTADTD